MFILWHTCISGFHHFYLWIFLWINVSFSSRETHSLSSFIRNFSARRDKSLQRIFFMFPVKIVVLYLGTVFSHVCRSVCLSVCLSVGLSVCRSACVSVCVCGRLVNLHKRREPKVCCFCTVYEYIFATGKESFQSISTTSYYNCLFVFCLDSFGHSSYFCYVGKNYLNWYLWRPWDPVI